MANPVIILQCDQTHNARRRALGSLQPRAPSLGRSLRESIYDGATASTGSSFIVLNVEDAVVISFFLIITVTRPLAGSKMSMPASGSVFVFQKRRRYSLLSLFAKWTLPVHGATSTLPSGLGFWSRMVIVADRGKVVCFALATPGVAT